jgi:hypothetical protein
MSITVSCIVLTCSMRGVTFQWCSHFCTEGRTWNSRDKGTCLFPARVSNPDHSIFTGYKYLWNSISPKNAFYLRLRFVIKTEASEHPPPLPTQFLCCVTLVFRNLSDSSQGSSLRTFCFTAGTVTLAVNPICRESALARFGSAYCS